MWCMRSWYHRALGMQQATLDVDDVSIGETYNAIANLHQAQRRNEDAKREYTLAMRIFVRADVSRSLRSMLSLLCVGVRWACVDGRELRGRYRRLALCTVWCHTSCTVWCHTSCTV